MVDREDPLAEVDKQLPSVFTSQNPPVEDAPQEHGSLSEL
jgi:hypothetical protein